MSRCIACPSRGDRGQRAPTSEHSSLRVAPGNTVARPRRLSGGTIDARCCAIIGCRVHNSNKYSISIASRVGQQQIPVLTSWFAPKRINYKGYLTLRSVTA